MTTEAVVAEPHSEDRIHRELQHCATKADLKDTELPFRTALKETELRIQASLQDMQLRLQTQIKDMRMWLLLRLGGLIVAVATIAVAVLKLLEGAG